MNTEPEYPPTELLPATADGDPTTESAAGGGPELRALPREVGVMLLSAGVVGFVMPGPGTPAIIAGGLVLWPQGFGRVEGWVQKRFPDAHRTGMKQIRRYLQDLEKRYPWSR